MRSRLALRRFMLVPVVLLFAGAGYGGAGCGAETPVDDLSTHESAREAESLAPAAESPEAAALRLRFPEHAARVLDAHGFHRPRHVGGSRCHARPRAFARAARTVARAGRG